MPNMCKYVLHTFVNKHVSMSKSKTLMQVVGEAYQSTLPPKLCEISGEMSRDNFINRPTTYSNIENVEYWTCFE